ARATAVRRVTGLSETSTIRARPCSLMWVSFSTSHPPRFSARPFRDKPVIRCSTLPPSVENRRPPGRPPPCGRHRSGSSPSIGGPPPFAPPPAGSPGRGPLPAGGENRDRIFAPPAGFPIRHPPTLPPRRRRPCRGKTLAAHTR